MKYLLIVFISLSFFSFSQEKFSNPLDIPMYLSGSFAELRSNHFHSGIDIKTNESIGFPVYAVKEGWVSRIKVSPWGFGYAIYVDHPNGYTSVYAHLEKFSDKISEIVLTEQYRKNTFSINKYYKKGEIPIRKSEIIAFSGNSGGSGGPHLHFELREQASQKPINPLQFNFDILDTIPPIFKSLVLYNNGIKQEFIPSFNKGKYVIKDTILVNDNFELGIVTKDESNNSKNRLGVNRIDYYLGNVLMYSYHNEKFSFAETRYANAHIDYSEYKTNKTRVQKLYVDPGNRLSSYSVFGKYKQIACEKIVMGSIEIRDSKKNKSVLEFVIKRSCKNKKDGKFVEPEGIRFSIKKENNFTTGSVKVHIPEGALYTELDFVFKATEDSNFIGNTIYSISKATVPLHKKMSLKILCPHINTSLQSKLVIVKKDGQSIKAFNTNFDGKYLQIKTKEFGDYSISLDTIPPKITFKSFDSNKLNEMIVFTISDNLSGISSFNGYVDGKWVLFKYDYKTKKLYYTSDKYLKKEGRSRKVLIKVSDSVGNISSYRQMIDY